MLATASRRNRPTGSRVAVLLLGLVFMNVVGWTAIDVARWANSAVNLEAANSLPDVLSTRAPARHVVGVLPEPANGCQPGQSPVLSSDFNALKNAVGEAIGVPRECVHLDPASGDRVQMTSTGLAVLRPNSGIATFTDGYRHWAIQANGALSAWEGDQADPQETTP